MRTFNSVDDSVIKGLNDKGAVKLLHKLIYAEAKRLAIAAELISVPYDVDTPDGGIDAVLSTGHTIGSSSLIFEGETYYQVKSGKVVFTKLGMIDVLCESKKRGVESRKLKPKVRAVAEKNGTLVLFVTGQSAPKADEAIVSAKEIIETEIPETEVSIKILQVDNIIELLDSYLSLRLSLLNIPDFTGCTLDEWSNRGIMSNYFEDDEKRRSKIEGLRTLLRSSRREDRAIRVIGYPGIGKTRSVLEALRIDDLSPLVVYFEKPTPVLEGNLITQLGARNTNEVILVIDECDELSHTQLMSALAGTQSNIRLVTIYNEELGKTPGVKTVDLNDDEHLSKESIVAIIEHYKLPNDVAQRWEPFCDGSPRVAHMIAENLTRDTGDIFANPTYDQAMERILANTEDLKSETYSKRRNIISWLALFHKFGWSQEYADERKFILYKIREKTNYSEQDIETVIRELKERKVLQGDKTLYISPRLLHIRAWVWWWQEYGNSFDLGSMKQATYNGEIIEMSSELYDWFAQMFEYAREVEGASDVVRRLLALGGPLSNEPELMEALSGSFFRSLALADPENALLFLEHWLGSKTDEQLRLVKDGRMNLVRILESIAVWNDLFVRATELLLRVAVTEDDHTYSNNSEGTFAGLFSNGPGKVAPTEASPPERLQVLKRSIESGNERKQLMAVRAIDEALESSRFTRVMGAEIQGLRSEPNLWMPKTYGEQWEAFKSAWQLLVDKMPSLTGSVRDEAMRTIDSNIRGLLLHTGHGEFYIKEYTQLVRRGCIPIGDAIDTVNVVRRFDSSKIDVKVLKHVQSLAETLEGDTVSSRLKRYIAHNSTEDWWGDDEEVKKSESKVAGLVKEILEKPTILDENEWLFTGEAQNAYRLGRGLGEIDTESILLDRLMKLQIANDARHKDQSTFMLFSGYISSVCAHKPEKWQGILDGIADDNNLVRWYPEACWRSRLDDQNAQRILSLTIDGKIDPDFRMFKLGATIKEISPEVFSQWMEYLLNQESLEATVAAIDLFVAYYVFQEAKQLPREIALKLLTSPTLLTKNQRLAKDIEYDWSITAERYIEQYPSEVSPILNMILANFGEDDTIFGTYGHYAGNILSKLVSINPAESWEIVAQYLEDSNHRYRLELSWLGGGMSFDEKSGALGIFPKDVVAAWIDKSPEKRAPQIAYLVPHDFDHKADEESWFALILEKYSDQKGVLGALSANFGSEGFSGPSSVHYAKKVEKVKTFAEHHKDSLNVQGWANKITAQLNAQVQDARLREERRGY